MCGNVPEYILVRSRLLDRSAVLFCVRNQTCHGKKGVCVLLSAAAIGRQLLAIIFHITHDMRDTIPHTTDGDKKFPDFSQLHTYYVVVGSSFLHQHTRKDVQSGKIR
jgi:hypothetical protein